MFEAKKFLDADHLAFRAACNVVTAPGATPLSRYILTRVSQNPEAIEIVEMSSGLLNPTVLNNAQKASAAVARQLGTDALWLTLVREEIDHLRRWHAISTQSKAHS